MKDKNLSFSKQILEWYDLFGRELPWRIKNYGGMQNQNPNPYHIWLSEIMLQQTQVATVIDYFEKFTQKWPRVEDLAAADLDDVLTAWAGLGYYARARNLHKCAKTIYAEYNGIFPTSETDLIHLPGVGIYTAAAISAIAFDKKANVVDGNIERIFSRVGKIEQEFPVAKKTCFEIANQYLPQNRFGDYAQALMDLGALICKPKKPDCAACPVNKYCMMAFNEKVEFYPKKVTKKPKKQLKARIFWVEKAKKDHIWLKKGQKTPKNTLILMQKRPEKGLLGNMMEFPSTEWLQRNIDPNSQPDIGIQVGEITHIFTHIKLLLSVWKINQTQLHEIDDLVLYDHYQWVDLDQIQDYALPTLMQKVVKLVKDKQKQPTLL